MKKALRLPAAALERPRTEPEQKTPGQSLTDALVETVQQALNTAAERLIQALCDNGIAADQAKQVSEDVLTTLQDKAKNRTDKFRKLMLNFILHVPTPGRAATISGGDDAGGVGLAAARSLTTAETTMPSQELS